jgi:uncharacterized membrane protein
MYKIIGADQKEYGPVDGDHLRQWIRQNRANAQTLVKPEESNEWKPLGSIAEFSGEFAPDNIQSTAIEQDASKGEAIPSLENLPISDKKLNIRRCLLRGIELILTRPGTLFGCTALAMLIIMFTGMPKHIGIFINVIISGPLYGGLFFVFLRVLRRQSTGIGDLFIGFREFFAPLLLAQVTVTMLTFLSSALAIGFYICTELCLDANSILYLPCAILTILGLLPPIYFSVCWFFTLMVVVDKRLDYWPAMEFSRNRVRTQWIMTAGLLFISAMIGISGTLFHPVGIFLTFPFFISIVVCVYDELFESSLDQRA